MLTQNRILVLIALTVALILSLPLIAMQFTSEVNWDASDFITMGILISGTGLLIEFTLRKVKTTTYRLMLCGGILFALFLVWAELAVGIFGTPFAGS